jgi:hypothetical protein
MSSSGWFPEDRKITNEEWEQFRQRYIDEIGFDSEPGRNCWYESKIFQDHPAFRGQTSNWARLMPDDSVVRLKSAGQPYETFRDVVRETAENVLDESEIDRNDLYTVVTHIIPRLRGNVDFKVLMAENVECPDEEQGTPYAEMTVVVKSINENNYEDWYVYVIEDGEELFGADMGSNTCVATQIHRQGIEPDQIISNIAFEPRDPPPSRSGTPSVPSIDPPKQPVTLFDDGYYEINDPRKLFKDAWGDVDAIRKILLESSKTLKTIGTGSPWWVTTGVNW